MPVQLIITMEDNGQIGVAGPLDNLVQCYGMLGCAKDAIKDYAAAKQNRIQVAGPGALVGLDGGKK